MKRPFQRCLLLLSLLEFFGVARLVAQPLPSAAGATRPTGLTAGDSGPRAQFAEAVHDFGRVMPADLPRHDFVVHNSGALPLLINAVNPGCGCTTVGAWDREIAPGKSGRITIEFNPANFSGRVDKTVAVSSNDPQKPTQLLEIRADVWRPFAVDQTIVTFLPAEGEPARETKIVRITSRVDEPAKLELAAPPGPPFTAELKTVQAGREFELHITYESPSGAASPSMLIPVKTSRADQSFINVSAFAMPQPAVVVIPGTLQLPPGTPQPGASHNIVVRHNASGTLVVTAPAATAEGIRVRVNESQPGRLFYVNVAFDPKFRLPAGPAPEIVIKTSHPKFREIRVPVVPAPSPAPGNLAAGK